MTYDLSAVRRNLPILNDCTYLNTGTVGIMAESVLTKHIENIVDHERGGHATQAHAVAGYERARSVLANLLNARTADLAFNRNATDGINWAAATFPLEPGDEVITSTEEHPAMVLPWLARCERAGAHLRFIPLTHDPSTLTESLANALSDRTRVVAISHVSCETGARVPVELIRDIVGDNVAILIDASQSVGQFPIDIPAMRADFIIGNGHKWLAGPKGTGFAWFDPRSIDLVKPAYFGDGAVSPRWTRAFYQTEPPPSLVYGGDATRFEFGTRAWHTYGALADAIEYQESLGWEAVFAHVSSLSCFAKQTLDEIPGASVVTPDSWENSSGIVTFTLEGLNGRDVSETLRETHNVIQRSVEVPSAVRVSVTYFTSRDDITRLADVVDRVSRGS
ncbi:MAG TPA: aminotransferase class V-fold PLP-dependent enzyme [Thermomicrobiales bacterium]|nr:aminotransferase class V-fold PLP-dependent enzyme [Thermomicrobiales bacterium]